MDIRKSLLTICFFQNPVFHPIVLGMNSIYLIINKLPGSNKMPDVYTVPWGKIVIQWLKMRVCGILQLNGLNPRQDQNPYILYKTYYVIL